MYEKMSEKERLMVEVTKDVTGLSRDKAELAVGAAILATTSKEAVSSTMEAFEVVEEIRNASWWKIAGYVAIGVVAWIKS